MRNDAKSLPTALSVVHDFFFLQIKVLQSLLPRPPPPNPHSQPFVNILRHSASIVQPISNP